MKTVTIALLLMLSFTQYAVAQNDRHVLKAGEEVTDAVPVSDRYYYPKFTTGNVMMKDGNLSVVQLNYNLLVGEMQFIASNGDTLSIADEATIKYISVGSDSFFYDKKYLQLVDGNEVAKLAKSETIKLGDIKKSGAYGQMSSTTSISTYSSLYTGAQRTALTQDMQMTLLKKTTFFIGDTYNHFLPALKKNVFKMYGQYQKAIEAYLQTNSTNFAKEEDLKKLVDFLGTLKS